MRRFLTGALAVLVLGSFIVWWRPGAIRAPGRLGRLSQTRLRQGYGKLPVSFERNDGQTDAQVRFLARGAGYTLFLTGTEAVLALQRAQGGPQKAEAGNEGPLAPAVLRLELLGANPGAQVGGLEELPGKSSYFIGNDPSRWRTNIPNYAKARYANVYRGVDLIYYGSNLQGTRGQLEYDFVVGPGTDPKRVRLRLEGADTARIDPNGDLVLSVKGSEVCLHKPRVYQPALEGSAAHLPERRYLEGHYALRFSHLRPRTPGSPAPIELSFKVAAYNPLQPLVIDPVLSYSTYLGGTNSDNAYGIAVDSSGSAYLTGSTVSTDFPTAAPWQGANGGNSDVFVTKLDPTGSTPVYSTYLGGSRFDRGAAIAVDTSGNAYITGNTASSDFPTFGAFQAKFGSGNTHAFVAKLAASGAALLYSSYVGGSSDDFGQGIAVDSSVDSSGKCLCNAYVTGSTQSTDFPTANAFQAASGGASDAFVAKVKADGSALAYSTYLGGSLADSGQGIAVDAFGNAYVTGYTFSTNFPTASPLQPANGGGADAFIAKLNSTGSALVYSTYLGGNGTDRGFSIAIDSSGSAYITGDSSSTNFTATVGAFQAINSGNGDAFVAKLNAAGSAPLIYFTFLGGSSVDEGNGIAVDSSGNAYVTGFTQSSDFPAAKFDALQPSLGGGTCGTAPNTFPCSDAFVSKLNPQGTALLYSTYLGGSGADFGQAIALDSGGNAYVAGGTLSSNFPMTAGAFQPVYKGVASFSDAFVAKINSADAPGLAFSPQKIDFGSEGTGGTTAAQTVTLTNAGSVALNVSGIAITGTNAGDFTPSNTCTTTPVTPGNTCSISVTFTPPVLGTRTANLIITDNAAGSPHQVALTGTGATPAPAVTLSPASLTFGSQVVGTSSAPQQVTLSNTGTKPLNISSVAMGGFFQQTNTCGNTVNQGTSCVFQVIFAPASTDASSQKGTMSINDDAAGSPQSVTLNGTPVANFSLAATPGSPTLTAGTPSTTFTISPSTPSGFSGSIALTCTNVSSSTCTFSPSSIGAGQNSTLTVTNLPTSPTGSFSFTVNGANGSQTATLSLTVLLADIFVSASPGLALITAGQGANYNVSVAPLNGFNRSVSLSCTAPLPQQATCSFSPATVTLDGSAAATSSLTVQTAKHGFSGPPPAPPRLLPRGRMLWPLWLLAFAALAAMFTRGTSGSAVEGRRVRSSSLALGVVLLLVVMWAGCENFGTGPFSGGPLPGTQPGNYTLTITGTFTPAGSSSSVSRVAFVNLSVS